MVGGVQTVRHTAAMSIWALLEHPDCWRRLQAGEVEPGHRHRRVAALDLGRPARAAHRHPARSSSAARSIEAGDRVAVWTWSANHDPAAFERPARDPAGPLAQPASGARRRRALLRRRAAGQGRTRRDLRRPAGAARSIELAGDPVYNHSIINFGFDHLPVRLHGRHAAATRTSSVRPPEQSEATCQR